MSTQGLEEAAPESIVDRRYLVRREIARGGMACVFEAEHVVTHAKVALKTLIRELVEHPDARVRLLREARVLGAMRHPNVVLIQDAGECRKHGPFLALQMIDGRPLDGILVARRRLAIDQAVAIIVQLCSALETVHRHGIVHRDVKPSNLLISRGSTGDQVELIDFGIATAGNEPTDPSAPKLTKMGELLGTVEYMSPEQIMESAPIDARTDVYAAGVVLYECLSGEVPFGGGPTAVITSFLQGFRPPSLRSQRSEVSVKLESALSKALEIDPSQRFSSAREFADACVAALDGVVATIHLLDVHDDTQATPAPAPAPVSQPVVAAPLEPAPTANPQRRRQFVRAPYVTPIRIVLGDNQVCDGRSEDISEGGVLIVADTGVAANQRVKLRLPLPTSGKVVILDATTKWFKTSRTQRAVGLEFVNAPEDVRAEIRAYAALMTGAPQKPPKMA
jgi:serine/threonine protein kinase